MAKKKKTAKKKIAKKKTAKKVVKKKTAGKKKAFGGYTISFKGKKDTVEAVFGSKPIAPSEMTKKIWIYVKENKLAGK
ncbi:hypothetical protein KKA47_07445 [bacterium]|nr:hypothetical protein [bacterium]